MTDKIAIINVTIPHFGSQLAREFLDKLAFQEGVLLDPTKRGELVTIQYRFEAPWKVPQFIKSLNTWFNSDTVKYTQTEIPRWVTSIEEFEDRLKHHDWYYDYSDDHRVWSAGTASLNKIRDLLKSFQNEELEKAQALYDKYSPFNKQ